MSDTTTPNLRLTLPAIGASQDSWGQKLNANFTTLDTKLISCSLSSPGWRIDVDGTIENWGLITTNSSGVGTFFFPKAFPSQLLWATVCPQIGSNFDYIATVGAWTTSSINIFSMRQGVAAPCGVFVRVLGH